MVPTPSPSSDDGINGSDGVSTDHQLAAATVLVTISGGTTVVNAGGDGVDSNGALKITGGTVVVNGPTANNNGALDANGAFTDTAGILMAVGSSGMAHTPTSSGSQGYVSVKFSATQSAGTIVHLVNSSGTELAAFTSSKTFQSVIYASSQITPGQTYRVYTGGSVSGTSVGGMYTSGTTSGATKVSTVTAVGSFTSTPSTTAPSTAAPASAAPVTSIPATSSPTTAPSSSASSATADGLHGDVHGPSQWPAASRATSR